MLTQAYVYKAEIINVVDGDTVDAIVDLGFKMRTTQRLRLLGINAPELHGTDPELRTQAQKAKIFLQNIILNKEVLIRTTKSDAFGRYLAEIKVLLDDGIAFNVNRELLASGLALPYLGKI
jgi:micrococcal nuclease